MENESDVKSIGKYMKRKNIRKRNPMALDLRQPKYKLRVVATKHKKLHRKRKHKGVTSD